MQETSKRTATVATCSRSPEDTHPDAAWFEVSLIPTTLGLTTLGHKGPGDPVNLEVDVLAKYVEHLLAAPAAPTDSAREGA